MAEAHRGRALGYKRGLALEGMAMFFCPRLWQQHLGPREPTQVSSARAAVSAVQRCDSQTFWQGVSWGLLGLLIVCLSSAFNALFVALGARLCQRLVPQQGLEKDHPHSTWDARRDQQGLLDPLGAC